MDGSQHYREGPLTSAFKAPEEASPGTLHDETSER